MYIPPQFEESRIEVLQEVVMRNPFGSLVTYSADGIDANHLPFVLELRSGTLGMLYAHVARNNPLWHEIPQGSEVLVIFRAQDAYVSPQWYPSKHDFHQQVPTWNYRVVHAFGRVAFRDDARYVRGVVAKLTQANEASQPTPWKMTDSSEEYISAMLKQIVGVEIEVTRLVGKFKLGQDEEVRDIRGAGEALIQRDGRCIGMAMLECANDKDAEGI
ncbi:MULTISPECIES: FMN-binding negative transcriptional regulator [unclassified Pseudomonas]|jgi:transcriptional regulator|uniref:FMN-binding negative transcriptional regulator n=1 Tax=unclassified Pseudomonas TaxID=196821 RepID=UPI001C493A2B|nr:MULTISPECIES: FMN-binding negative transcriptional regulator [unclassified Pseudomonas]MBV7480043.1 FMN-binding negative transcriptional regulator [Pseudomonas sp. PDM31]MDN4546956.1 FMN-binding negative transcriptional regulator [Pseudomonas sp. C32]